MRENVGLNLQMSLELKQRPFLALAVLTFAVLIGDPASSQTSDTDTHTQCLQSMKYLAKQSSELLPFLQFFQNRSRRAQLENGQILAAEEGTRGTHFWVLVLNEAEKTQLNISTTFQFDQTQDLFIIPAVPMSPLWMGMGCIHETVHAKDILEGTESRNASRQEFLAGELRAYQIELQAIDTFTNGAFSKALVDILESESYWQSGPFIVPNQDARKSLDNLSPQSIPQSQAERSLRDT